MRLLLWVLLATLVTFLSSCEAATPDTNKRLQRALYTKLASHDFAVDSSFNHGNRLLRGENANLKAAAGSDAEERGFGQKAMEVLRQIKDKYLRWELKRITPGFQEMADKKITYSMVRNNFRTRMMGTGWWSTPSGFKRYARLYQTWAKKNGYPDLAV
ncbi:hypothetical protein PHYPSEUDO_010547 [Phytophthora pseudosyringae]|uniref:RxLR effector protein n=1 Tax=Phytophthora pseudosyringae TaxID=221518 RepID=A0A8T1VDA3_9STRA|nr:hypothetical protein PHYPSEUDO_010547 [Phytophthora pseudosyringae]